MRTRLDCIPCFFRGALEAARFATDDENVHEAVLREVMHTAFEIDMAMAPPAMAQRFHRTIRNLTGVEDPYLQIKQRFNREALRLYDELSAKISASSDPFQSAVRAAIAGNVIDFGHNGNLQESHVAEALEWAFEAPICGSLVNLKRRIDNAGSILFLTDNCGEIVFDRLLIERLPLHKVTVAVRGHPVLNDATMEDARTAGLTGLVEVIDNGSDAPGTILETCSESFRQRFAQADLVIAKGQGNFETLSSVNHKSVFLLKAKCPVVADELGVPQGSLVIRA